MRDMNNVYGGRAAVTAATPPMMQATPPTTQDREEGEVVHIIAPKGKLGVTLENLPWGGESYVAKVSSKSPLFGRVQIGDKVMAVDGDNVQQVSAKDISKMLAKKKKNPQRQITITREGKKSEGHQLQPNNSVPSGMNNMGNDPSAMAREGYQMDDSQFQRNHSSSMNNMGNGPYGMGREGNQRDHRDDRNFQRNHSTSGMNSMGIDRYGIMQEGSWRENRNINLHHSAHGIFEREGGRRDDHQFQRRRMSSDNDPYYGMGREGSRREDRDFHHRRSLPDDMNVDSDLYYRIGREGSRREVREVDFNQSAPIGMNMNSDPYNVGRERVQRLDRGSHFNYNPVNSSKEKQRRISSSSGLSTDSDLIDPYSHEGNNHLIVEPATQYADSKSKYSAVTVIAPRGKLGVVLEDGSDGGPSFVSEVREDSVLKGEVVPFDRISSIDGQDVKELKAFHISKLLAHKSRNVERKIVFLREKNESGQNKFMV